MSTNYQPPPTSLDDNILSYIRCIQLSCQSQSISKKQIYNFFTKDYDTTTTKEDVKQSLKRLVKRNCIVKDGKKTYSYIQQQQISLESSDQKVDSQSSSDDAAVVSTSQSQQKKKRKRSTAAIVELNDQGDKKLSPPLVNEKKERKIKHKRSKNTTVVSPTKVEVVSQSTSNPSPPQSIDISPTTGATAAPKSPSHPTHQPIAVSPAASISQQTPQQKKTILRETDTILPLPTVQVKEQSSNVDKPAQSMPFKTPLSYTDLQFIKSQQITNDKELAAADISKLVTKYINYTTTKGLDKISSIEAQLLLGLKSQGVDSDLPSITQIPKESQTVMDNVPNLCITDTSGDLVSCTDLVFNVHNV